MKTSVPVNRRSRSRFLAVVSVAAVLGIGYWLFLRAPAEVREIGKIERPQLPSNIDAVPNVKQALVKALPIEGRADEVARLVSSGSPADAFNAAQIIIACLQAKNLAVDVAQAATNPDMTAKARADYAGLPSESTACAGISPGQLTQVNHLLTVSLALSDTPGMFKKIMNAAAFSAADTMKDSEFSAAIPAAMEAGLLAGDGLAFSLKANEYAGCGEPAPACSRRDPAKMLAYATASRIVYEHDTGKAFPTLEGQSSKIDPLVSSLSKELSQQQIADAIEEGKAMVYKTRGFK